MKLNTNTLMSRIIKGKDIKKVLENNAGEFEELTVSDYLNTLCSKYEKVPEHVIKKAQLDRTYGHQIFNGTRLPSRDKLIQLAFGFEIPLEETQKLLRVSGKSALYPKVKRDAVCIYAITHNLSVMEVQELLAGMELPILGGL